MLQVRLVLTKSATFFLERAKVYNPDVWTEFQSAIALSNVQILRDEDEWAMWNVVGDKVLHIEVVA